MKMICKQILAAVMMGFVVPWIILLAVSGLAARAERLASPQPNTEFTTRSENTLPDDGTELSVLTPDGVKPMALESYIAGVVLAEMPAEFEVEALKAQAVVARTYALRRMEQTGKHTEGDVCTDSNCCQGYSSPEEYILRGGSEEDVQRIQSAVNDTWGKVLTYEGKLIEATYFSCSGGQTEDALAVWGADIPYLQSTVSPGEEHATHYTDTVTLSLEEFKSRVDSNLPSNPNQWFGAATYTTGGGVKTIKIGEKIYKGTEVRTMLSLRSTDFTIRYTGQAIEIVTHGYGHRVGMSQYGADAMALAGSSYAQILAHYYQGTELKDYHTMGN